MAGTERSLLLSVNSTHEDSMTVTFPNLVKEAAEKFRNYCTAFTQFKLEGGNAQMRLQAMEIMQEFVGSVDYGIGIPQYTSYRPSVY